MIQRILYYSQLRKGMESEFQQVVKEDANKLLTQWEAVGLSDVSLFCSGQYVCMYAELVGDLKTPVWDWSISFQRYLEKWPIKPYQDGGSKDRLYRLAIPMIDIFHDGIPEVGDSNWRSDANPERIGSIAQLKPEMVSSYIYYHYQLQEETPNSFNQTYMIGLRGTILFSYHEMPAKVNTRKRKGLLTTNNTPDNWHEVMYPHFELWQDEPEGQRLWVVMERLI